MRSVSLIATLYISFTSATCLVGCDITPKSPVLAGDTGESSNEEVGTILPDPPPAHPPSSGHNDMKKADPDGEPPTSLDGQTSEKGPE